MEGMNLEGILQGVLANPKLLTGAMELAAKLTAPTDSPPPAETFASARGGETGALTYEKAVPASSQGERRGKGDMKRHKKLLEALALYVSEDKRDKIELMIKALELFELAESMGFIGGKGV